MGNKFLIWVVGVSLLIFVEYSQQCKPLWANDCNVHGDCCTGYCHRDHPNWKFGVCKVGQDNGVASTPALSAGNFSVTEQEISSGRSGEENPSTMPSEGDSLEIEENFNATQRPPFAGNFSVSQQEFNNAITQNGFELPSYKKYICFLYGTTKGQITTKREAAMALAQFIHESGGLKYKRETDCEEDGCPTLYREPWCDAPGKYYYGRGYLQLTGCGNYRAAGRDLGLGDQLVLNPDSVAEEEQLSWDTAFSFWKREVHNGRYGSEVQEGMFGSSTRAINGQEMECQGDGLNIDLSQARFNYYKVVFRAFAIEGEPDERGCSYK